MFPSRPLPLRIWYLSDFCVTLIRVKQRAHEKKCGLVFKAGTYLTIHVLSTVWKSYGKWMRQRRSKHRTYSHMLKDTEGREEGERFIGEEEEIYM